MIFIEVYLDYVSTAIEHFTGLSPFLYARLSSDKFHSWGALFGIISFIEKGYLPAPEEKLRKRGP